MLIPEHTPLNLPDIIAETIAQLNGKPLYIPVEPNLNIGVILFHDDSKCIRATISRPDECKNLNINGYIWNSLAVNDITEVTFVDPDYNRNENEC